MVRVQVLRRRDGNVYGFVVRGHAGHAPRGRDIVCAGVSALTQTAALGLAERLGVAATVRAGEGRYECRLPEGLPAAAELRAQDLLETMCLGLREIAAAYPREVLFRDPAAADAARVP